MIRYIKEKPIPTFVQILYNLFSTSFVFLYRTVVYHTTDDVMQQFFGNLLVRVFLEIVSC